MECGSAYVWVHDDEEEELALGNPFELFSTFRVVLMVFLMICFEWGSKSWTYQLIPLSENVAEDAWISDDVKPSSSSDVGGKAFDYPVTFAIPAIYASNRSQFLLIFPICSKVSPRFFLHLLLLNNNNNHLFLNPLSLLLHWDLNYKVSAKEREWKKWTPM